LATANASAATVVLIGPPHVPFGPALAAQGLAVQRLVWVKAQTPAERLWSAEQALRCEEVAAVLAWLPQSQTASLRRLHMAAHDHAKLLFVMRPAQAQRESSPAPLRLMLLRAESHASAGLIASEGLHPPLRLHLLKRRGPPLVQSLVLPSQSPNPRDALDRFAA
jgi:protein ImuA